MAEATPAAAPATPDEPAAPTTGAAAVLAELRARGADGLDPVRFHYLETLARRLPSQDEAVRRVLEVRLAEQVAAYGQGFEALGNAGEAPPDSTPAPAAEALPTPLAELAHYIAEQFPAHGAGSLDQRIGSPVELKTMRIFRDTWTRLSVEKQVSQAIEQAPENAGPLNSHLLVLRSLGLMRDLSPAYLGRFMAYVDALVRLDTGDGETRPVVKSATENDKKRKTGRAKTR